MSQFPQNGFVPQQQFQQPQGQFPQQPQQGFQPGFQPQQQGYGQQPMPQQPQQQMPQMPKVPFGQGYQPGQFPHENNLTIVGQIFPNQWMPTGIEFKPGNNGGQVNINIKVRNAWGNQPNQVKIQFLRVVAFGPTAQQIANGYKMGQIVRVNGEFRPNKYKSNKGQGPIKQVNQIILSNRQGGPVPIQVLGELPMFDEYDPNAQQNGGGGYNQGGNFSQQGGFPQPAGGFAPQQGGFQPQQQGQFPQAAPQQFQPAPQQQFQQPAPQGQFPPQQAAPQAQFPQQQQPQGQFPPANQFQPQFPPQGAPQGQFPQQGYGQPQGTVPSAGVPMQPQPGQTTGNFAPPQQQQQQPAPAGAPQGFTPPEPAPVLTREKPATVIRYMTVAEFLEGTGLTEDDLPF